MTWVHVEELAGVCASWVSWKDGRCPCTTPQPDPASPCGFEENALFGSCGMGAVSWQHFRCIVSDNDPEGPCPEPCPATAGCHPHLPTRCLTCQHPIRPAHD